MGWFTLIEYKMVLRFYLTVQFQDPLAEEDDEEEEEPPRPPKIQYLNLFKKKKTQGLKKSESKIYMSVY